MQETLIWSLGWKDPLEKGMTSHPSILAWRVPETEVPGRLQSTWSQRVGHDWVTNIKTLETKQLFLKWKKEMLKEKNRYTWFFALHLDLAADIYYKLLPMQYQKASVQFSSVAQSCPILWDPMNPSTPGFPVHHQLPEFTQSHVHWVGDAIQPSHPLSSPSPPGPNPSQH